MEGNWEVATRKKRRCRRFLLGKDCYEDCPFLHEWKTCSYCGGESATRCCTSCYDKYVSPCKGGCGKKVLGKYCSYCRSLKGKTVLKKTKKEEKKEEKKTEPKSTTSGYTCSICAKKVSKKQSYCPAHYREFLRWKMS